jgi:predicted DNA-binding transcriptional regulator YafY
VLAPTSRLLELLELVQAQPRTTGREIADRLGIDRRTVRRYVTVLKSLGIPIEGERGVGGGYRLRPGYRLPPLMLSDDEAVVVVLGLAAARRLGRESDAADVDGALTKIHRVLPDALRRRVEALEETLGFLTPTTSGVPVAGESLLLLADAIRRRRRVRTRYRSHQGEETQRELSAHGLVLHSGRWYLAAFDHAREDLRTFRVDRMRRIALGGSAVAPPEGFDTVAHVSLSLARVPWPWEVEVVLELPVDQAARRLPATLAELAAIDGGTLVRARVISLDWMASVLAGLDVPFTILGPDELRRSVQALAGRLADSATRRSDAGRTVTQARRAGRPRAGRRRKTG